MLENRIVYDGKDVTFRWFECDDFGQLKDLPVTQVYLVAFVDTTNVIVAVSRTGGEHYVLPGGTIEKGETIEQAMHRELAEETNAEVISWLPLGYQEVHVEGEPIGYQARALAKVRQIDVQPFLSDPDGDIVRNEIVPVDSLNKILGWGVIGDRLVEIANVKLTSVSGKRN